MKKKVDGFKQWDSKALDKSVQRGHKIKRLRIGQQVTLKANKAEGWPEEQAEYQGRSGKGMAVVIVEPQGEDDGIREVSLDQIKELD